MVSSPQTQNTLASTRPLLWLFSKSTVGSRSLMQSAVAGILMLSLAACHRTPETSDTSQANSSNNSQSSAASVATPTATSSAPAAFEFMASDIAVARRAEFQSASPFTGTLSALRHTLVQAQTSGNVLSVTVQPGAQVKRGELIAVLGQEDASQRVLQAQAAVASARAQWILAHSLNERHRKLLEKGFVAKIEYERSSAEAAAQAENLKAQQALLAIAQKAVRDTRIVAPQDGTVARRLVEPGQAAAPGQAIVEIVDLSMLELEGRLSAASPTPVTLGQQATFQIQSESNTPSTTQSYTARVTRINPVVDASNRSLTFYAQVPGNGQLRPGVFVQGKLLSGSARTGIVIPAAALTKAAGQSENPVSPTDSGVPATAQKVWVIRNQRLVHQPVTVLARDALSNTVMVDGISAGETVVLLSLAESAAGQSVRLS